MGKQVLLTLESLDVGKILDGLRSRQEAWTNTAIFLSDDYFPNEPFLCEECSNPDEAQRIADDYQRIILRIEEQLDAATLA